MQAAKATRSSVSVALGFRAARLLAMAAIVFALESFLDAYRLAALLLGAFAVDLLAGKTGMRWDETGTRTPVQAGLFIARGFILGVAAASLVLGVAAAVGLATVTFGTPSLVGLGLGMLMPFAQAARDELLFRGAPLALMRGHIPDRFSIPFVALLGGAPLLLLPDRSFVGVAIVVFSGLVFAIAWRIGNGMFLPWGAHAGWLFMFGAGTRGSLLDVTLDGAVVLPFVRAQGAVAWLTLGVVSAVALSLVIVGRVRKLAKHDEVAA